MKVVQDWRWSLRLLGRALEELRIRPVGVLHVGAHRGEEVPIYQACGFGAITLVEPDPDRCAEMAGADWIHDTRIGIINQACGPAADRATFYRAGETQFSGLQRDRRFPGAVPIHVRVTPVADVQSQHPANLLVVDTQGTELDVLRTADMSTLDLLVIETQTQGSGAPGAYWPDLLAWCDEADWHPRIQWQRDGSWSDTLLTPRRRTDVAS